MVCLGTSAGQKYIGTSLLLTTIVGIVGDLAD
jgi:hypothetical protein